MLTTIAIIVGVLSLLTLWFVKCIIVTKPGYISLVGDFGTKPERIIGPGWDLVFWPFELLVEMISTERQTYNIPPTTIICTIDPIAKRALSLTSNGVTSLVAEEISVLYQVNFGEPKDPNYPDPEKLNAYFELGSEGQPTNDKVREIIKDMAQGFLRDETRNKGLIESIAAQDELLQIVKQNMIDECTKLKTPIKIIDLIMNKPMKPTEERIRKAIEDKSVARIERAAAVEIQNLAEFNAKRKKDIENMEAERNFEIKKMEAEAEKAKLDVLAERWGVNKLPAAEQAAYWLSREALEAYKEMAKNSKSTYVVSGNVLGEIQAMLKNFSGGK